MAESKQPVGSVSLYITRPSWLLRTYLSVLTVSDTLPPSGVTVPCTST